MSRYMMFITHEESLRSKDVPASLNEAMGQFINESIKSGKLIDTAGLQATEKGSRVRLSKGRIKVTDGPFTEAKEVVGGYALVEAASTREAVDLATQFMDLHRVHWPEFEGSCEVRPLDGP